MNQFSFPQQGVSTAVFVTSQITTVRLAVNISTIDDYTKGSNANAGYGHVESYTKFGAEL